MPLPLPLSFLLITYAPWLVLMRCMQFLRNPSVLFFLGVLHSTPGTISMFFFSPVSQWIPAENTRFPRDTTAATVLGFNGSEHETIYRPSTGRPT